MYMSRVLEGILGARRPPSWETHWALLNMYLIIPAHYPLQGYLAARRGRSIVGPAPCTGCGGQSHLNPKVFAIRIVIAHMEGPVGRRISRLPPIGMGAIEYKLKLNPHLTDSDSTLPSGLRFCQVSPFCAPAPGFEVTPNNDYTVNPKGR